MRLVAGLSKCGSMLGEGTAERACVASWLAKGARASDEGADLDGLDAALRSSSYVAGARFTAADLLVLHAAHAQIAADAGTALQKRPALSRWVDQVQREAAGVFASVPGAAGLLALHCPPVPVPQGKGAGEEAREVAAAVAAVLAAPRAAAEGAPPAAASSPEAPAGAPAAEGGGATGGGGDGGAPAADDVAAARAQKKAEKEAKKAARAAQKAANEAKASGAKGGGGKKKGGGGAAPAADDGSAITKADIRVGHVVKAYAHPEREKLVCEEIDVGEDQPRTIASGVREHYKPEEVQGRMVVVLCNLPPRKMGDEFAFKSNGMVLCASSADHSTVRFLEVPEGAKPGERVSFPGHEGEPLGPKPFAKKKWLPKILPGLKVGVDLQATWEGVPFTTSAGPCFVKDKGLEGMPIG